MSGLGDLTTHTITRKKPQKSADKFHDESTNDKPGKESKRNLLTVASRMAGDVFHYLRWYYQGCQEAFPDDPEMRYVDRFFPHAEGGGLYVDEPRYAEDVDRCKQKKKFLESKGMRYLYITQGMTDEQAFTQMAETWGTGAQA